MPTRPSLWDGDSIPASFPPGSDATQSLIRAICDISGSDRYFFVKQKNGIGSRLADLNRASATEHGYWAQARSKHTLETVARRAASRQRPVSYRSPSRATRPGAAGRRGASLCVPVVLRNEVVALLFLERRASATPVSVRQRRLIEFLVEQTALTIELAEQCRSELRAFQARVNSPFLHNTLSVIAETVVTDPARAEAAIVMLSRVCRYVLASSPDQIVTLAEELAVTKDYLTLEQLRLGDKMQVEIVEEGPLERIHVPARILQGLVEIATRVGIARRLGAGHLRVEVLARPRHCRLRVRGRTLRGAVEDISGDIALAEMRRRLHTFYPGAHTLRIGGPRAGSLEIVIPRRASSGRVRPRRLTAPLLSSILIVQRPSRSTNNRDREDNHAELGTQETSRKRTSS
jgi:Histidine kinase